MKKKKKKKRNLIEEIVKANRKNRRNTEIEQHGHPLMTNHVFTSKKIYNRKRLKVVNEQ